MQTNGKSTVMSEGRVCFFTSDIQQKKKKNLTIRLREDYLIEYTRHISDVLN